MEIKFISYTGKYPNLCDGILTLEIDEEQVSFGHDIYSCYDNEKHCYKDGNYDSFWHTGGCIRRDKHGDYYSVKAEWIIDESQLPDKYKEYSDEIAEVFNSNVPYGCCGGCT